MYVEELTQYLKENNIHIKVRLNHVQSPDYLDANVLPKQVRQDKINSLQGIVIPRIWEDLYGHYYNPEANGQWDYFKYFTEKIDNVRNENLNTIFSKLE
jgi:hypothetical protein